MGDMPAHVPPNERSTWNDCPDCPVTDVAYDDYARDANGNPIKGRDGKYQIVPGEIQIFLESLNKRVEGTGCTYDLPSLRQLQYSIRADTTG